MNSFFFSFSHLSIVLLRIYFVTPIKKQYIEAEFRAMKDGDGKCCENEMT